MQLVVLVGAVAVVVFATSAAVSGGGDRSGGKAREGLRVNASELAAMVWESRAWPLAEPPRCTTRSPNGLGPWRCSYRFVLDVDLDDFAPVPPAGTLTPRLPQRPDEALMTTTVEVTRSGFIRGGGLDGRPFTACCLELR